MSACTSRLLWLSAQAVHCLLRDFFLFPICPLTKGSKKNKYFPVKKKFLLFVHTVVLAQ